MQTALYRKLCLGSVLLAASLLLLAEPAASFTERLQRAWEQTKPLPRVSESQPQIALHEAYELQRQAVTAVLGTSLPGGFKAGLTSKAAQKKFAAQGPVAGVLWPGLGSDGSEKVLLDTEYYRQPMMELELGYRFHARIEKPLSDVSELQLFLKEIVPVVEVPDLGFAGGKPTVEDIVAANVAAARYIEGEPLAYRGQAVNTLRVALKRGAKTVSEGEASSVMGDQWQALLWLVNQSIAQGWSINPDQLLITGAIGPMVAVKAGRYEADFGPLGQISIELQ